MNAVAVIMSCCRAHQRSMKITSLIIVVLLLQACAGSSVFFSYPDQIKPIKKQISANQFKKPKEALNEHREDADKILYMMERGRVAQIEKDYAGSMADFKVAMEQIKQDEDKAKVSASNLASSGAALMTNDNAIPYEGDGYEKIFLYFFQALNYLYNKDVEGSLVELRRANEEQTYARQQHEAELTKGEEEARKHADQNQGFMDSFQAMADIAGRVKDSFQNAYTFYASGVIYEATGQLNDAYIYYKQALEIYPDNPYVQKDVLRLAKVLHMDSDLKQFSSFKVVPDQPAPNEGSVVIFYEHGFAPPKGEVKVRLHTLDAGLVSAAFPTYLTEWQPEIPLVVATDSTDLGNTSTIVNIQAMAAKALQEKLPGMMVRQILRIIAKNKTNKKSEDVGAVFSIATKIFNAVTEKADRRSWLTLPHDVQVLRRYLPEGEHSLSLSNGLAKTSLTIKVVPNKTTIIRVVGTGPSLHSDVVTL